MLRAQALAKQATLPQPPPELTPPPPQAEPVTPVPVEALRAARPVTGGIADDAAIEAMRAANAEMLEIRKAAKASQIAPPLPYVAPQINQQVDCDDDQEVIEVRNRPGGRVTKVIVMGPPKTPFMLTLGRIFKSRLASVSDDSAINVDAQLARLISYVRSINGQPMPDPIVDWKDVVAITHQLGDLGERAARECYEMTWPDGGQAFWSFREKHLPEQ